MLSIVLHGIVWYCIELLCILWYSIFSCQSIVSYGIAWYCIISYGIAWYCIVGFGARAVSRKTPIYFMQILCYCLSFRSKHVLRTVLFTHSVKVELLHKHQHEQCILKIGRCPLFQHGPITHISALY